MIVWNPAFLSEHESAWGLLQKLSWFNEASPVKLFQRVSTLRFGPCDPSVRARTFMDTDWLGKEPIPCEPPEPADAGTVMGFANLQRAIVQRSGKAQWGDIAPIILDAQLRYCPACLAQGYHSIVHQLCGLAVCPRHRLPLVRHCIHCHAATPLFALRTHPQAFRCQRCRQSWLDGELEPITTQDAEWNDQTIGCVRRWGARIAALPYEWKQWDVEIFHDHAFPTDAVTDGMVSIGQAAVWLLHDVEPFPEPGWLSPRPRGLHAERGMPARPPQLAAASPSRTMTLHKLGWEVDAYIRRQWLGNHRACILHTSTFIPIPKMRGVSDVIPHLCPIAQAHRLWQKRMDDALFRTFLSPTLDRHPLSQEQVDTFCAAWLSMFHYAVQCVQRALQPDIRSARDAVGLRAVEPWLRSFGDAWRNGLMQLRSLRPEEDPRPYVVHYRNDLRMSPLSCTVGHWPGDVARLAHAEIRPWSDRRGHIDPRTGTFIADTLQLHAEP